MPQVDGIDAQVNVKVKDGWRERLPASEVIGLVHTGPQVQVIHLCDLCESCGWLPHKFLDIAQIY